MRGRRRRTPTSFAATQKSASLLPGYYDGGTAVNPVIRTIEVEIDESGKVQPADPTALLPQGRALLSWQTEPDIECMLMSETSLAVDWLRPEEDEAWAYLQPVK